MFKIILIDGQYRPVIACDWCGERIAETPGARYEWLVAPEGWPSTGHIFYAHRTCSPPENQALVGGFKWISAPLDTLPFMLMLTLGIIPARELEEEG